MIHDLAGCDGRSGRGCGVALRAVAHHVPPVRSGDSARAPCTRTRLDRLAAARHASSGLAVVAALLALALGCGARTSGGPTIHGPDESGTGRISLALQGDPATGALTDATIVGFRVRFHDTKPASLAEAPYFYSTCWEASAGFTVDHLKIGNGFTIVYEGYSDSTCSASSLAALGVRGDVSIQENGTGDAYYYIQVNRKGAFTAFPTPGADLNPSKGGVACPTDDFCRELIDCPDETCPYGKFQSCDVATDANCSCPDTQPACKTGQKYVAYRVHPAAVCDVVGGGICRLKSLFPLNTEERRAFHAALPLAGGRVELVGGVNAAEAKRLSVQGPATEGFDGALSLFFDSILDDTRDRFALATPVAVGDGTRFVLIGGASAVGVRNVGGVVLPAPAPETCTTAAQCTLSLTANYSVLDLDTGTVTQGELPFSTEGAVATAVATGDGTTRLFVRPGLVLKTGGAKVEIAANATSYLCDLDDASQLTCAAIAGTDTGIQRAGATGVCLKGTAAGCEEFMVLGGNAPAAGPDAFAEVFVSLDGSVRGLAGDASLPPTLIGSTAAVAASRIWTFGGSTAVQGQPNAAPMAFTVDSAQATIRGQQVVLDPATLADASRFFHQATVMADGAHVMVSGGIGSTGAVLDSALVFLADATGLTLTSKAKLASPRLGHGATVLKGGLLDGAVLVTGGLTAVDPNPKFANGAELYLP
jgi:hypothetical protein